MKAESTRIVALLSLLIIFSGTALFAGLDSSDNSLTFPRYFPLEPHTSRRYLQTASDGTRFIWRGKFGAPAFIFGITVPVIPAHIIPTNGISPEIHYEASDGISGWQEHGVDWPDMGCAFRYSPPYQIRNGMLVGDSYKISTTVTATGAACEDVYQEEVTITFDRFEPVTVPAGSFDCAKVRMYIKGPFSWTTTFYFVPDVGVVKTVDTTADSWSMAELMPEELELLDPVPSLLEEPSRIAITSNQEKLAKLGIQSAGVAADGVAKLVIRYTAPAAGSVTFSLREPGNPEPLKPEEDGGTLNSLQDEFPRSDLTISTFQAKDGKHRAVVIYRAPAKYVRGDKNKIDKDKLSKSREVLINAQFMPASGGISEPISVPIVILRPMVFLVHGLWAGPNAWDGFSPLINDVRFYVRRADYSSKNDREFEGVAGDVYVQLQQQLVKYKRFSGVAAIQADVVAHSMGGPAVRTMAIQPYFLGDYCNPTFGKGPIYRLITIAGVHVGSGLANYLLDEPNRCLADLFKSHGHAPDHGGVRDLAVGSEALQKINSNQTPFPVHTIVGQTDQWTKSFNEALINFGFDYVLPFMGCRGLKPFSFDELLKEEQNDLLVAASSQLGGRAGPGKWFDQVVHDVPFYGNKELASGDIAGWVIDLLNGDSLRFRPLPW